MQHMSGPTPVHSVNFTHSHAPHTCALLQVYQLLLGVTALSLLATPLVIMLCSRLLREPLSISIMKNRTPLMADASSSPEPVQKNSARLALGKD